MPPPLADDKVTYVDGIKTTLDQEARTSSSSSPGRRSRISRTATAPVSA